VRVDEPGRRPPSLNPVELTEDSADSADEPPRWGLWLAGTGFVAIVLILASLASPWVRHEWALSLSHQNTPYTQLAFSSAVALPTSAVRGHGIPVSFTIANNEGKQVSYRYVVSSGSGSELESLTSATKGVSAGNSWDVDVTVVPKCAASTCRIKVSLPKQGESIYFVVTYQVKDSKK
jgi:hypothetical protein